VYPAGVKYIAPTLLKPELSTRLVAQCEKKKLIKKNASGLQICAETASPNQKVRFCALVCGNSLILVPL